MLPLICAATLLSGVNSHQTGQPSIFDQVIREATGKNAYEYYAKAADMVSGPEFSVYVNWPYNSFGPPTPEDSPEERATEQVQFDTAEMLKGRTFLQAQRVLVEKYGDALATVRQGLLRDVWQPRKTADANTMFPEFKGFKSLTKLFVADAYVKFADGQDDRGTADLIDGLKFADHQPIGPLIGPLVSIAMDSIVFRAVQQNLGRITVGGWREIADLCDKHLADNSFLVGSIGTDRQIFDNTMGEALSNPDSLKSVLASTGLPAKAFANLPPGEIANLTKDARAEVDAYYSDAAERLRGPEESWQGGSPQWSGSSQNLSDNPSYDQLLAALEDSLSVDFGPMANAASRARAQWRVLRLHALIQSYRWENNQLPPSIQAVADEADLKDPLSGKELVYMPIDNERYQLYSKGSTQTGEVGLIYHGPPPSSQPAPPQ